MQLFVSAVLVTLAATFLLWNGNAKAEEIEVLWLGHATVRITSVSGKVIVVDPFLTKNPTTPARYKDLSNLGNVDLILVTHGHIDHVGDLGSLAELTDAPVVANWELRIELEELGLVKPEKLVGMNKGGTVTPIGAGVKIHMVPAEHSSSLDLKWMGLLEKFGGPRVRYAGSSVGFVIELENGFKIYHTGDSDIFEEMRVIQRIFAPDLALVAIGGHFTMGPDRAALAVREYIKPKRVLPIHYGTYPVINRTPEEFVAALGETEIETIVLKPGEAVSFP